MADSVAMMTSTTGICCGVTVKFGSKVRELTLNTDKTVLYDVISLYTCIPTQEAVKMVKKKHFVLQNQFHPRSYLCLTGPLSDDHLLPVQWRLLQTGERLCHGLNGVPYISPFLHGSGWEQSLDYLHRTCSKPLVQIKVYGRHVPEANFTAQSLLLYSYGAKKEINKSSHFSLVVVFWV